MDDIVQPEPEDNQPEPEQVKGKSGIVKKPEPPALPATTEELEASRKLVSKPTLNDLVERIHKVLTPDPDYRRLLHAVYHEQAVEGLTDTDDTMAAQRIRLYAVDHGDVDVANEKISWIVKALKVVLRRYGQSRKERRNMIGGQIVPNGDDD